MKETKNFFDNNRLNRGASKVSSTKQSDANITSKKYQHVLPPIDMMEQYEELNPGACAKLFEMAAKEQAHRHSVDLLALEQCKRATSLGRASALAFIAIIAITNVSLIWIGGILLASVFTISAFACIAIITYLYSKNSIYRESTYSKYSHNNNGNRHRNHRNHRSFSYKPK